MSLPGYFTLTAAAGLGCALLGASFGAASAADTQASWQGILAVTAASAACAGVASVGDHHVSIYRPKIKRTDTETYLSVLHLRAANTAENTSESTVHQMNGNGSYRASEISSKAEPSSYTGTYSISVSPFPVTARTALVSLDGTITNYFNQPGCDVTFHAEYVPDF
jgi:hypothetical protein